MASGTTWKRMRTIMNPSFTAYKLKEILPLMQVCSQRFLNNIEANEGHEINVTKYLDKLSMDAIWSSAFGFDINCQTEKENLFLEKGVKHFKHIADLRFLFLISR